MNKAFLRESDSTVEYCPRCGSLGQPVAAETLKAHLGEEQLRQLAASASFCPLPQCAVAYFDAFERVVLARDLPRPVYPKDPDAPICACFGLTRADVERDLEEGAPTRTKALLLKARSPEAACSRLAANGQPCVAYVQKLYLQGLKK
jgi:hypothetical protein